MYYGMFYDWTFIILVPAIIFTFIAQGKVNSAYNSFARIASARGISGEQAARKILDANGLFNVDIGMAGGKLSDHYDPMKRNMKLSPNVFGDSSIASVAIAAHESGHAIQHAKKYAPLLIRNVIALPVSIISWASWPLLIAGIILMQVGKYTTGDMIFDIGACAFAAVVLFYLITLPVELDASKRAIRELETENIILPEETAGVKKVLSAAAMTYVAALAMAAAQFLRILLIRGRN